VYVLYASVLVAVFWMMIDGLIRLLVGLVRLIDFILWK